MAYKGNSIIDYLKSVGQDSSYTTRAKLAKQQDISNYTGTAAQNLQLLGILNKPAPAPAPRPAPRPAPAPAGYEAISHPSLIGNYEPDNTITRAGTLYGKKKTVSAPAPAPRPAPAPASPSGYTGSSIIDYSKSIGQPSDYASRAKLAAQKGITNYTGTAEQNTQLLNLLRSEAAPAVATTPKLPASAQVYDGSAFVPLTAQIKPIGEIKSEYEKLSPLADVASVADLGTGNADINTITDNLPKFEAAVGSMEGQIATLKSELTAYWDTQIKTKDTEIQTLNDKISKLQEQQKAAIDATDPSKSQFYDQETTILQNQLDAAELASTKLTEDYNKARELTNQLNDLNNQSFADIQAMKNVTGLASIRTPRINQAIDNWQGRSSILQAALAGVQNNINLSYQYINQAQADITARKNEEIAYYTSLQKYYAGIETSEEKKLVQVQKDKQGAIDNIINIKVSEINQLEAVSNMIKKEMINNPARIAGAGINLATDNLDTISRKLAEYDYGQEVIDNKNEMEKKGYTYLSNLNGITSENQITRIRDSKGVERIYRNPPEKKTGANPETYDKVKTILENTKGADGFVNTDEYKKQRGLVKDKTTFDKNYSYMLRPTDIGAKEFFTTAEIKTAGDIDWEQVNPATGKTPEQAFIDLGISQDLIDMAKTTGLSPAELLK